jgi:ketosteroid isomerase-like protein
MLATRKICGTVLASIIIAASAYSAAQATNVRADDNPAAAEEIKKLEVDLCGMLVRGAWDSYAANLTDDYVRVLPGNIQSKQEVLAEFRASKERTISMVPERMDVRVYGDTAVALIHLRTRSQDADGKIVEHLGMPTKIFVRRNGKWYLAQLTGTPLK